MIKYKSLFRANGGVAQLARAFGSYPTGRWFKSCLRYHELAGRQARFGPLVKRLRHGPFTAVTWVRFPYGSPKNADTAFAVPAFFLLVPRTLIEPTQNAWRFEYGFACPARRSTSLLVRRRARASSEASSRTSRAHNRLGVRRLRARVSSHGFRSPPRVTEAGIFFIPFRDRSKPNG